MKKCTRMSTTVNITVIFADSILGINIRAVRGDKGAFLESFYRSKDGGKLHAESSGILECGDQIVAIEGADVSFQSAARIGSMLSSTGKQFKVEFLRHPPMENVQGLLHDPRLSEWLRDFLSIHYHQEEQRAKILDKASLLSLVKILLDEPVSDEPDDVTSGLAVDCVMFCIEQYPIDTVPDGLRDGVALLVSSSHPSTAQIAACLSAAHQLLESDLAALLSPFLLTPAAKQLVAWMAHSPPFHRFSIAEILDDRVLATGYFLFLCHSGRHRNIFLYLRGRNLCDGGEGSAGRAKRRKVAAAEAVRDGFLLAFYASSIYEAILSELHHGEQAQGQGGQRWREGGALQRVVRGSPVPPGISLHRRQTKAPVTILRYLERSFRIIQFGAEPQAAELSVSIWAVPPVESEDSDLAACDASLLPFVVPAGLPYASDVPRLLSFVIPCADGSMLYGASLAFYRFEAIEPDRCAQGATSSAEEENPAPAPSSPVGTAPTPHSTIGPVPGGCAFSPTASPRVRLNQVAHSPTPSVLAAPTQAGRGTSEWFGSVLNEAEMQRRALQASLTTQAGTLVTGIRQWGDQRLPQLASTLMSANIGGGGNGATAMLRSPPRRPLLSPLLRAVGLRPPQQLSPAARVASPPRYQLRPRGAEATPLDGDDSVGVVMVSGVAVVTATPAVSALRLALEIACRESTDPEQELEGVVEQLRDQQAGASLLRFLGREPGHVSAAGAAWDFHPQLLYEVLSPAALTTIFLAFLVECKILVVSETQQSAALYLGEWLRQAVAPLQWCHVYNPVAPQTMALDLLHCPAPFFLGMLRSEDPASASVPADVLVVDLDEGALRVPRALESALPAAQRLCDQLCTAMRPNYFTCDQLENASQVVSPAGLLEPGGAVMLCRGFVAALLRPADRCCLELERGEERLLAFDEQRFLGKAQRSVANAGYAVTPVEKEAVAELVQLLMRAQCFSEYVLSSC